MQLEWNGVRDTQMDALPHRQNGEHGEHHVTIPTQQSHLISGATTWQLCLVKFYGFVRRTLTACYTRTRGKTDRHKTTPLPNKQKNPAFEK